MIMVFSFAERPVVLALRHRSVLAGVVVRVIGDVQLPVAPGVHLLPLQAALAEQVPADGTRGRGFQPGPARTAPMGKGQVPGTCAASIPNPSCCSPRWHHTVVSSAAVSNTSCSASSATSATSSTRAPAGASSRIVPTAGSAVSSATSRVQSILANGNIKVKIPCGIGESTVCMLRPGDLVDLNGLVSSTTINAKFYAVGNTTVLSMHKSKFDGLVNSHPLMMCRVLHGMMLNLQSILRRMNNQIADLRNYVYGTNSRS